MKRRGFLLAGAVMPLTARQRVAFAQAKQAPVIIGWLSFGSRDLNGHLLNAFKDGLAALGWKEGARIAIEERWVGSRMERLQPFAEELASINPALIVAPSSQAAAAAAKAAPRTPIVIATGGDPVTAGFAVSLARPGGMITGVTNMVTHVQEKFVELLLAAAPKVKRIGFLIDITGFSRDALTAAARRSAVQYSVDPRFAEVSKPGEIESALARLVKDRVQALAVLSSPLLSAERRSIVKFALAQRWPVVAGLWEWAEEGALLAYGVDTAANYRRAAYYVDRILRGAKPGDLPFEQPTKVELLINRKTARALGITLSESLLLRADKVIE